MKNSITAPILFSLSLAAFACGGTPATDPDGVGSGEPDAPIAMMDTSTVSSRPTWMLEDVQPESPRVGQTYGLDTFGNKTVVVVLLEGF
jgi:hypothetical protein